MASESMVLVRLFSRVPPRPPATTSTATANATATTTPLRNLTVGHDALHRQNPEQLPYSTHCPKHDSS